MQILNWRNVQEVPGVKKKTQNAWKKENVFV